MNWVKSYYSFLIKRRLYYLFNIGNRRTQLFSSNRYPNEAECTWSAMSLMAMIAPLCRLFLVIKAVTVGNGNIDKRRSISDDAGYRQFKCDCPWDASTQIGRNMSVDRTFSLQIAISIIMDTFICLIGSDRCFKFNNGKIWHMYKMYLISI